MIYLVLWARLPCYSCFYSFCFLRYLKSYVWYEDLMDVCLTNVCSYYFVFFFFITFSESKRDKHYHKSLLSISRRHTQKMFEQNEILHVSSRQAVVGKCQIIKFYRESQNLDLSQGWDLSDTDKNLYFLNIQGFISHLLLMWEQNKPVVCANSSKQFVILQRTKYRSGWPPPFWHNGQNSEIIKRKSVFTQFTKLGGQQRMYLSQHSALTKGAKIRKPQKQRQALQGAQQVCLTPTEDLDAHWDSAPAWAGSVLCHVLHIQDKKFGFTVIQKANIF